MGLWPALAAAPAMIGSLLLLVVLFGWLGRAEALVLLGWLASAALVGSPVGERLAVRGGCGFRRPSPAEAAALAPLWAAAMRQSGTVAADVDLYVQPRGKPTPTPPAPEAWRSPPASLASTRRTG